MLEDFPSPRLPTLSLLFVPLFVPVRDQPSLAHDRCAQGGEENHNGIEDLQANVHQCGEEENEEHTIDKAFPIVLCDAQVRDKTEEIEKNDADDWTRLTAQNPA